MLNIVINGCNGKMGQVLSNEINKDPSLKIVAGIDRYPDLFNNNYPVFSDIFKFKDECDVIIDFSNPYYLQGLLDYGIEKNVPIVIATTGFSAHDLQDIKEASKKIPIFHSANMSLGINLLISLVKKASKVLQDSFDIEIIEKHHNKKIDSPSGTAYMIANEINKELNNSKEYVFGRYTKKDARQKKEIGIHAIRGGTITGEHQVIFAGEDEIVQLNHMAHSKSVFAIGSIKAAKYLVNKKNGLFGMDDLVNTK